MNRLAINKRLLKSFNTGSIVTQNVRFLSKRETVSMHKDWVSYFYNFSNIYSQISLTLSENSSNPYYLIILV